MNQSQHSGLFDRNSIALQSRGLIKGYKSSALWLQILLDQAVVIGLLVLHTWIRIGEFPDVYRILVVATMLVMAIVYQVMGVYQFALSATDRISNLAKGWVVVVILLIFTGFITKTSNIFSREVILVWSLTGFIGQCISYLLVSMLQSRSKGETIPTLLVGARSMGNHLATHINENKWMPDRIVGVVDDDENLRENWHMEEVPVLGTLDDILNLVEEYGIRRVYLALPLQKSEMIEPLYLDLINKHVDIIWAPDIFGVNLLNHSIKEVAGIPLISMSETPLIGSSAFIKTVMDVSVAFIALVVLSPVMLLTALLIKLSSGGPVLFLQDRQGWDGKVFTVFKFRSMIVHEEADGVLSQARKGDDRVTAIGKLIRRTSIDELPQLFNVLKGEMSIVGPRPHAIQHDQFYSEKILAYMSRHRVKPGLTGLAQVNGFRGETESIENMADRIQYDLAYINNWSVWLDIKIMFRTIFVLLSEAAY